LRLAAMTFAVVLAQGAEMGARYAGGGGGVTGLRRAGGGSRARHHHQGDGAEADHAAVLARLVDEGTAFLVPARIDGRPGIRACVTNYWTTHADIDLIVAQLSDIARRLSI
jgi:hypothetical protein